MRNRAETCSLVNCEAYSLNYWGFCVGLGRAPEGSECLELGLMLAEETDESETRSLRLSLWRRLLEFDWSLRLRLRIMAKIKVITASDTMIKPVR